MPYEIYVKDVSIPVTIKIVGQTAKIECPDAIIKGTKGVERQLEWRMDTLGYEIDDINFVGTSKAEFPGVPGQIKKLKGGGYRLRNKMSKKDSHKYDILVLELATGKVTQRDPMIRNEPD